MTLKKILICFITLILAAGASHAAESFENSLDNLPPVVDNMYDFPYFKVYKPKKGEIVFNESSKTVNSLNPTAFSNKAGGYLPGARGTNQLVVYTYGYSPRTGTNEFGAEAIVEGNTVTELSGADSFIPQNGLVISGHGAAKNWIVKNISVGTKVYLEPNTNILHVYTTSESYLFEASKKIDEAKAMVDYYKSKNVNYDFKVPNYYIREAMSYLKKAEHDTENIRRYSHLAIESANTALKSVVPYKHTEFKGVWVRPVETNEEAIEKAVKRIKAAGIDNIFIETYFHGRTIFPSKTMSNYGFVKQNEKFDGIDPLKLWVKYAHKNNIKVHVWFETFYVGIQRPETNPGNILAVKPHWANKTKRNYNINAPTPSISEHNGFFLDPANPEVQEFLQTLITEIVDNYKVDGINLDYIRYPQAVSFSDINAWGYTDYARNEFKTIYGKDPLDMLVSDPLWMKWCEFRREKVSNFVAKIGALGREKKVYVSAVIFPDRLAALNAKQQDWKTWSTRGYINGFTPLFLTCNAKTLNALITNVINAKSPETDLFAGLFVTFMGGSEEDLIREIHETRKMDVKGVILFDYAHLDNRYIQALATRVFSEKGTSVARTVKPSQESSVKLKRIEGSKSSAVKSSKKAPSDKKEKKRFFSRKKKK